MNEQPLPPTPPYPPPWKKDHDQNVHAAPLKCEGRWNVNAWGNIFFGCFLWTHGFSPNSSRLNIPPPYSLWNHAPISLTLRRIASCGIFISFHFTWYSQISIYCAWLSTINLRHQPFSPIHKTSINGRALALSSFPWFHAIFSPCTIKIPRGQNRGVTFPSPLQ